LLDSLLQETPLNVRMRNGLALGSSEDSRDSFDDISAEEMLVINPNVMEAQDHDMNGEEEGEAEGSNSLVVTNLDLEVFEDDLLKAEFESRFLAFDPDIAFYYIRTFRRVRLDFSCSDTAAAAKGALDGLVSSAGNTMHCFFLKVFRTRDSAAPHLAPPPFEKQFLISPPCSPPVGWEQPPEDTPVVDYDLLAAMASMQPGEDHELHPSKSVMIRGASVDLPSIVVHVCHGEGLGALGGGGKKLLNTKRPPGRQHSIED